MKISFVVLDLYCKPISTYQLFFFSDKSELFLLKCDDYFGLGDKNTTPNIANVFTSSTHTLNCSEDQFRDFYNYVLSLSSVNNWYDENSISITTTNEEVIISYTSKTNNELFIKLLENILPDEDTKSIFVGKLN